MQWQLTLPLQVVAASSSRTKRVILVTWPWPVTVPKHSIQLRYFFFAFSSCFSTCIFQSLLLVWCGMHDWPYYHSCYSRHQKTSRGAHSVVVKPKIILVAPASHTWISGTNLGSTSNYGRDAPFLPSTTSLRVLLHATFPRVHSLGLYKCPGLVADIRSRRPFNDDKKSLSTEQISRYIWSYPNASSLLKRLLACLCNWEICSGQISKSSIDLRCTYQHSTYEGENCKSRWIWHS